MKNLMFAQSRFVFMSSPEGFGAEHLQALKTMKENFDSEPVSKDDIDKAAVEAVRNIKNSITDPNEQTKVLAKVAILKRQLDNKIVAAKQSIEDVNKDEVKALQDVEKTLEAQAKALIETKQVSLRQEIAKSKAPLDAIATMGAIATDAEFVSKASLLSGGLYAIDTVDITNPPNTFDSQEINDWASKLSDDIKSFSVAGDAYKEISESLNMRQNTRKEVQAMRMAQGYKYFDILSNETTENMKKFDSISEPSAGASKEDWAKYKQDKSSVLSEFNANAADYSIQREKDKALRELAKRHIGEVKAQLEGGFGAGVFSDKPINSEAVKKAGEALLTRAVELSDGQNVAPTFGNRSMVANMERAQNDLESKYNAYQGELKAQQMNEVAKDGQSKAVLVYEEFQADKFKTFAEFSKAFDAALAEDKKNIEPQGRHALISEDVKGRVAVLKSRADELRQVAQDNLTLKQSLQFITDAKDFIEGGVDTVLTGLKTMAEEQVKEQARQEAVNQTFETIDASKKQIKTKGPAGKKALNSLSDLRSSIDPANSQEVDLAGIRGEASRVVDEYLPKLAAHVQRVAAARRAAKRSAQLAAEASKDAPAKEDAKTAPDATAEEPAADASIETIPPTEGSELPHNVT